MSPQRDHDAAAKDCFKDHVLLFEGATDRVRTYYLKTKDNLKGRMQSTYLIFHTEGITICGDFCPGTDHRNSGVTSDLGYGLMWFANVGSKGYLCEKFLHRDWHRELAEDWCRTRIKEIGRGLCDQEINVLSRIDQERRDAVDNLRTFRKDVAIQTDTEPLSAEIAAVANKTYADLRQDLRKATAKIRKAREKLMDQYEELADQLAGGDFGVEGFRDRLEMIERHFDFSDHGPGWGYDPWESALLFAIQQRFKEEYWKSRDIVSVGSVDLSDVLPGGPIA